jgi:sulfide:quinone oxidoreductase
VVEVDAAGNEKRTHALPYAYSVYWPAFGGVPGVRGTKGVVNARGLVVVDEYLRNPDYPNIFALGACVAHPPVDKTPVPVGAPDSVYAIQRAGEVAVQNILAQLADAPLVSYVPQRAKWLSDMGSDGAAYLAEPHVPMRDINWMRQGRWVHQAKVDFEKYFINKIRLQPGGHGPSPASGIADVMSHALAEKAGIQPAAAVAPGGGKPLEIHLPQEPCIELRALARSLGREPDGLAAELLAAAVADAKAYLDEDSVEALAHARRALLVEELPERQPGVEFHGGGT